MSLLVIDSGFKSRAIAVIDSAQSIEDLAPMRHKAEALRKYAKAATESLEVLNTYAEIKVRAERKAGALLAALRLHGGNRRSKSHDVTLKLKDLHVGRHESSRWQALAKIPQTEFEGFLVRCREDRKEITSASLLRLGRKSANRPSRSPTRPTGKKLPAIDPPDLAHHFRAREIVDHVKQLEAILQPLLATGTLELNMAERRLVKRYLREVRELVAEE